MEQEVLEQLHAIYNKENLEKDSFFREMTQQHPEGCKFIFNTATIYTNQKNSYGHICVFFSLY